MKQGIHPEYRDVVFQDISTDFAILTRSTVATRDTIKWEDGNEYPLVKLEISSQSHPFYTGKQHILQTAKQVDKLRQRLMQPARADLANHGKQLIAELAPKHGRGLSDELAGRELVEARHQ